MVINLAMITRDDFNHCDCREPALCEDMINGMKILLVIEDRIF
ncbi:MAG: hypothetical protein ACXAEU_20145 [Candidatus Hodarchaeales archaeon]